MRYKKKYKCKLSKHRDRRILSFYLENSFENGRNTFFQIFHCENVRVKTTLFNTCRRITYYFVSKRAFRSRLLHILYCFFLIYSPPDLIFPVFQKFKFNLGGSLNFLSTFTLQRRAFFMDLYFDFRRLGFQVLVTKESFYFIHVFIFIFFWDLK